MKNRWARKYFPDGSEIQNGEDRKNLSSAVDGEVFNIPVTTIKLITLPFLIRFLAYIQFCLF